MSFSRFFGKNVQQPNSSNTGVSNNPDSKTPLPKAPVVTKPADSIDDDVKYLIRTMNSSW